MRGKNISTGSRRIKNLEKINSLLKTIQREPFTGEGKPEPLKDKNGADGLTKKTGSFIQSAATTLS